MKKTFIQSRILGEILLGCVSVATTHETTLSLAGAWKFRLDADNVGVAQTEAPIYKPSSKHFIYEQVPG